MNTAGFLCFVTFMTDAISASHFSVFPRLGRRQLCQRRSFSDLGTCTMQCNNIRGCRRDEICCPMDCGGTYCQSSAPMTAPPTSIRCPSISPRTACFGSPCEIRRSTGGCQGYPGARCEDDFCGGCNARYFYGDQEITPMCSNRPSLFMFV